MRDPVVAMPIRSILALMLSFSLWLRAEKTVEELTAESVAKCKATADQPATLAQIVAKVDQAAALLSKEGTAAFPRFKGADSEFLFGGTYIWIHTLKEGKMVMHPIKHKMEGKVLGHLRDRNGKMFFAEMADVVKKSGSGWVEYVWPKPGETDVSTKVSYVNSATVDGVAYVIGCGIYDKSLADVKTELGN